MLENTFENQANVWLDAMTQRKRRPVKPATLHNWRSCLKYWLVPNLGNLPLSGVANGALKQLIEKMDTAGLSPKSIVNYVQVVKLVVASAVNDEGEQIHPRKWNHDFVGLPIVNVSTQKRPTITTAELEEVLEEAPSRFSMLFTFLAGTGLRIGEAVGLRC